jgi:L-alanine-DL-glutamate epimerase-like enolase superfamily enzyme
MKIRDIKVFHVDAGWRPWTFIKIETNDDLIGWSECSESHGSPNGIEGVIKDLTPLLLEEDPRNIIKLLNKMYSRTRQSPGSIVQKAIAGIENALWDIKAKDLNIPVYELFGGPIRNSIPLYWSHCGTTRIRAHELVNKPRIKTFEDLRVFGEEVKSSGFGAIKTNIGILDPEPFIYMPGFSKSLGGPELNISNEILNKIDKWIEYLKVSMGDCIDIALDLNYNFKTEGYIKIGRLLEKYNLSWLEIDTYNAPSLRQIKDKINTPITSGENLYRVQQYNPFFLNLAMDNASIDVIWNGFSESKRIAEMADLYEINVCPHNYNGHLSTFISLQFCSVIPNFRIAEIDVDDVPWREELFTSIPKISNGVFELSNLPGWGCNLNESVALKYKWDK